MSRSCDTIWNCPFRSAPPQRGRPIQAHFKRPNSNPNHVPDQTQAQPRKRIDIGGKVGAASNDLYMSPNLSNVKQKALTEHLLSLFCRRRERALSKINSKSHQRTAPAPAVFPRPQSPTSTWSPTASPSSPLPTHVYYTPAMDEPLALIKKPRKEPERQEEKAKIAVPAQIQVHGHSVN